MKNLKILVASILIAFVMGSCSPHIVKKDSRFQTPGTPAMRVIVTSYLFGPELVEGNIQLEDGCLNYSTIIKGKTIRRMVCDKYALTGVEDSKSLDRQLKN